MNISTPNYNPNFCARPNTRKVIGVSLSVAPQITRLTAISNIELEANKAVAYTRNGEVLSTDYNSIMSTLRSAVTELSWSHKYNSARGTWCKR